MRGGLDRLAAMTLVALLAGPSVAPWRSGYADADKRDASTAQDGGMNVPPGPAVSAAVSVPAAVVVGPLLATTRVVVSLHPLACGRPGDRLLRPAIAVKPAPTILRV